jgi:hypothetical protein
MELEDAVARVHKEVNGAVGHDHQPVRVLAHIPHQRSGRKVLRLRLEQELAGGGNRHTHRKSHGSGGEAKAGEPRRRIRHVRGC